MIELPPLYDYSTSRAVVMGTSSYNYLSPVPAATNSLRRMLGLLTGPLCGWPDDRLLILENEPSPGNLPDQLITAFENVTGVALFYYVGHGLICDENQLGLSVCGSRPEPNRRAATSLPFQAVRRALLDSKAVTKIVMLDCCFAGLANELANTLAPPASDVLGDMTAGSGAYTMAASGAYATAWYETNPGAILPQTYFTKYLVDLLEAGIPGQPSKLQLHPIFTQLRDNLERDQRPVPSARGVDAARTFVFAHNIAPPQTHRDPEAEIKALTLQLTDARRRQADFEARLLDAQHRLAQEQRNATARERALLAEARELAQEIERLKQQASGNRPMTSSQWPGVPTAPPRARGQDLGGVSGDGVSATATAEQSLDEARAELRAAQAGAEEAAQELARARVERRRAQEERHLNFRKEVEDTAADLIAEARTRAKVQTDTAQASSRRAVPASGMEFTTKHALAMREIWRLRAILPILSGVALVTGLANLFRAQPAISIAAQILDVVAAAGFATTAFFMLRARLLYARIGVVSPAIIAIGVIRHFFVRGWLPWIVVIILLIGAAFAFLTALYRDIPNKQDFLIVLKLSSIGTTLIFGDGAERPVPWSAMHSTTLENYRVKTHISLAEYKATGLSSRLYYNSSEQILCLFYWNDFGDPEEILNAIQQYSGQHVIRRPRRRLDLRSNQGNLLRKCILEVLFRKD